MATDDKLNEEVDQFMAEKGWQFMAYAVNRHFSIQEDQKPVVKKLGPKSTVKMEALPFQYANSKSA